MPPANDNFADAILLTGASGSFSTNLQGCTKEPGEPLHSPFAPESSTYIDTGTIWYKWVAPSTGILEIVSPTWVGTIWAGPVFAVYREAVSAASPGKQVIWWAANAFHRERFPVEEGVLYHWVLGVSAGTSPLSNLPLDLEWSYGASPENDNVEDAILISGFSGEISGNTARSTNQVWEPESWGSATGDDSTIWYKWVAPLTGRALFEHRPLGESFDDRSDDYVGSMTVRTGRIPEVSMILDEDDSIFLNSIGGWTPHFTYGVARDTSVAPGWSLTPSPTNPVGNAMAITGYNPADGIRDLATLTAPATPGLIYQAYFMHRYSVTPFAFGGAIGLKMRFYDANDVLVGEAGVNNTPPAWTGLAAKYWFGGSTANSSMSTRQAPDTASTVKLTFYVRDSSTVSAGATLWISDVRLFEYEPVGVNYARGFAASDTRLLEPGSSVFPMVMHQEANAYDSESGLSYTRMAFSCDEGTEYWISAGPGTGGDSGEFTMSWSCERLSERVRELVYLPSYFSAGFLYGIDRETREYQDLVWLDYDGMDEVALMHATTDPDGTLYVVIYDSGTEAVWAIRDSSLWRPRSYDIGPDFFRTKTQLGDDVSHNYGTPTSAKWHDGHLYVLNDDVSSVSPAPEYNTLYKLDANGTVVDSFFMFAGNQADSLRGPSFGILDITDDGVVYYGDDSGQSQKIRRFDLQTQTALPEWGLMPSTSGGFFSEWVRVRANGDLVTIGRYNSGGFNGTGEFDGVHCLVFFNGSDPPSSVERLSTNERFFTTGDDRWAVGGTAYGTGVGAGGGTLTRVSSPAPHAGSFTLKFEGPGAGPSPFTDGRPVIVGIPCTPSTAVAFRGYVHDDAVNRTWAPSTLVFFKLFFKNSAGTQVGTATGQSTSIVSGDGWMFLEAEAGVPSTAVTVDAMVMFRGYNIATPLSNFFAKTLYMSDFSFIESYPRTPNVSFRWLPYPSTETDGFAYGQFEFDPDDDSVLWAQHSRYGETAPFVDQTWGVILRVPYLDAAQRDTAMRVPWVEVEEVHVNFQPSHGGLAFGQGRFWEPAEGSEVGHLTIQGSSTRTRSIS